MAAVDVLTLMMAIQAVRDQIARYEALLTSGTLRDPEEIQSLIVSYEKAQERPREAHESEWREGSNLRHYSKLVPARDSSAFARNTWAVASRNRGATRINSGGAARDTHGEIMHARDEHLRGG
jgi:hypothetical protein